MVKTEVFPSGLRLVTDCLPHVRSASIGVWLDHGSRHESIEQSGISHFIEHMLFKGTSRRTARQLAQAVDAIGGYSNAYSSSECIGYYIKSLDEQALIALDILSDMALNSLFSPDAVEIERAVILEEIKMRDDDPGTVAYEQMQGQIWAGHPMGRDVIGSKETVSAFTVDQLKAYFAKAYTAPHLVVVAAGNIVHNQMRDAVGVAFESLAPDNRRVDSIAPVSSSGNIVESEQDIEQSHVCLGLPTFGRRSTDRYALYVMNMVLGAGSSSRLFQSIREERGLAYSVGSHPAIESDCGILSMSAGCAPANVDEVVAIARTEFQRMRSEPVTNADLRLAKDALKGGTVIGLEDTMARAQRIAESEMFDGWHSPIDLVLEKIEAVTINDVQRVASDLLLDASIVASVVGPKGRKPLRLAS